MIESASSDDNSADEELFNQKFIPPSRQIKKEEQEKQLERWDSLVDDSKNDKISQEILMRKVEEVKRNLKDKFHSFLNQECIDCSKRHFDNFKLTPCGHIFCE